MEYKQRHENRESLVGKKYHLKIDRESYYYTFQFDNKQLTVVSFHAITKKMQPETEIKYFKFLPDAYPIPIWFEFSIN
jgi:hypothetical protein